MTLYILNIFFLAEQTADPKELKRQRERERYARNKDNINKKKREARQLNKVTATNLNGKHSTSNTAGDVLKFFHFCK